MIIKKDKISSSVKNIIDNHGLIKKIRSVRGEVEGYLIRKEEENNDEYASVVFNIFMFRMLTNNFFKRGYWENNIALENPTKFSLNELRYCAIESTEKKRNAYKFIFNSNDEMIDSAMEDNFNNFINELVDDLKNVDSTTIDFDDYNNLNDMNEYEKLAEFLKYTILKIKNYYKNKKIFVKVYNW